MNESLCFEIITEIEITTLFEIVLIISEYVLGVKLEHVKSKYSANDKGQWLSKITAIKTQYLSIELWRAVISLHEIFYRMSQTCCL